MNHAAYNMGHWFVDDGTAYRFSMYHHRLVNGLFNFTVDGFSPGVVMVRFSMMRPKHSLEFLVNWSPKGRDVERHEHWNRILAIGLWGGYVEESWRDREDVGPPSRIQVRAPYIRWLPREHRVRGRWVSFSVKWPFALNESRPRL